MNEFAALRTHKSRRDKLIQEARDEYESSLLEIAKLEQNLTGKHPAKYHRIGACIEQVIPRGETFTTKDILIGLEALDSRRYWRVRSVNSHISTLRDRGIIKRLSRPNINAPAVYVRADADVEPSPVANLSLLSVIKSVLKRPMTTMDVVFAVREAGYQTTMTEKAFYKRVVTELGRGVKRDGSKWVALGRC